MFFKLVKNCADSEDAINLEKGFTTGDPVTFFINKDAIAVISFYVDDENPTIKRASVLLIGDQEGFYFYGEDVTQLEKLLTSSQA